MDAGGKLEAANKPDQGEVDRAERGRAARRDRAGWPAERRQVAGETGRRAKGKATQGHRAKRRRAARGDRAGGLVERQQKGEKTGRSAEYEATCGPKGGEGKGYKNPGPGGMCRTTRRQPTVQRALEDGHCA